MSYLVNSQWISRTALPAINKLDQNGVLMPPINVTTTTTGRKITCFSTNTGALKNGDLVLAQSGFSQYFFLSSFEVFNVVPNESFDISFPLWTSAPDAASGIFLPITNGDLVGSGGNGPDGWSKTPSLKLFIDDFAVNASTSQYYQVGLIKGTSDDELFFQQLNTAICNKFGGLTVSFSAEALVKSGNAKLIVTANDTTQTSFFHTNQFERVMISMTLPSIITNMSVGIEFSGAAGNLMYFSKPTLVIGADRGWVPTSDEYISPIVKISPLSYIGAALNFANVPPNTTTKDIGWYVNPHAETNGSLGKGIKTLDMQLEARCDTTNCAIGTRNQQPIPVVYGTTGYCKVPGQMEVLQGLVKLANDQFYIYSKTNNPWYNASIDINSVITW